MTIDIDLQPFLPTIPAQIPSVVSRLRIAALLFVLLGLVLLVLFEPTIRFFRQAGKGASREWADALALMRASWTTDPRAHWLAAMVVAIVSLGIRAYLLFQPIRYDEAFTFLAYVSKPWYLGVADYSTPNNHVLNTLLAHFCYLALGSKVWVLRLPAFLAGVSVTPATYLLCRVLSGKDGALFAAEWIRNGCTLDGAERRSDEIVGEIENFLLAQRLAGKA